MRKPVFGVSDQVRHKPGCSTTEDGSRLIISDLGSRGIVELCSENKGADQLHGYRAADLRLCFGIYAKSRVSHYATQIMLSEQNHHTLRHDFECINNNNGSSI